MDVTDDGDGASSRNDVGLLRGDLQAIGDQLQEDFLLESAVEDQALTDDLVVGLGMVAVLKILRIDLGYAKRSVWWEGYLFDHSVAERVRQPIKNEVIRLHLACG